MKIKKIACGLILMLSLTACSSTEERELNLPYDELMNESLEKSEVFYYAGTKYTFEEEWILDQEIYYDKDTDAFYIDFIMSEEAYYGDDIYIRAQNIRSGGSYPHIRGFMDSYYWTLYNRVIVDSISDTIVLRALDESGEVLLKSTINQK